MTFDPYDHTTWWDDPDDFVVPPHELDSVVATAQADAEEAAQARAFYGSPAYEDGVQREALSQMKRQQGYEPLIEAIQALIDSQEALLMTVEDMAEEMHRRDGDWERRARGEEV